MKILALQPSVSIILESLGRLDALCGCTRYCLDAVPALRDRGPIVVRDSWTSHTEEIVDACPDLVIASVPYRMESLAAILKAGVPVLALAPHSVADIYADIRLIGSVVGECAKSLEVVEAMQAAIASIARATAGVTHRPLVYCEEWGKPLIHSQFWVKELVEAAAGRFAGEPGKVTGPEAIAAADPEVIVLAWCGAGDRVPVRRVMAARRWEELQAVKSGRAICIRDESLNTPAPTLVAGLKALAEVIHPELFGGTSMLPLPE